MNALTLWNRDFDRFLDDFEIGWRAPRKARTRHEFYPHVDVEENTNEFLLSVDLPGVKKDNVNLEINDGTLTLSGERISEKTHESGERKFTERSFGKFSRSFTLPSEVATDSVKADFSDGVLTIKLPKSEKAKPKRIEISN